MNGILTTKVKDIHFFSASKKLEAYDDKNDEIRLISLLTGGEDILKSVYSNTRHWSGCFGAMLFISYTFLLNVSRTYNLPVLLGHVQTRKNRMSFERLIGCTMIHAAWRQNQNSLTDLSNLNKLGYQKGTSYLGSIHTYCQWGIQFKHVLSELHRACYNSTEYLSSETNMPVVKVWSGR